MEDQRFFTDDTSIFIAGNSVNNVQSKINETINKLTEWLQIFGTLKILGSLVGQEFKVVNTYSRTRKKAM
jgi:hypothetical protein